MSGRCSARRWHSSLVLTAAMLSACTGAHLPSGTRSPSASPSSAAMNVARTIPWQGRAARVNSRAATGYTLPAPSGRVRRCRLSNLAVVPFGGGAAGTFIGRVSVHNVSTRACSVRGRAAIELIDRLGRIFQSTGPDPQHRPVRTVVLVPNSWVNADLGGIASDICGGDQTTTLRFALPGESASRSLHFPVGRPPDPGECGGRIVGATPHPGQLAVGPFQAIPKPQDDFPIIRSLSAKLFVPPQVQAGAPLMFTVEFTNTDAYNSGGIDQNPCPIFQMTLAPTTADGTFLLPCTPFINLRPGESVAFGMRLDVPADATPGPATLYWRLREPDEQPLVAHLVIAG